MPSKTFVNGKQAFTTFFLMLSRNMAVINSDLWLLIVHYLLSHELTSKQVFAVQGLRRIEIQNTKRWSISGLSGFSIIHLMRIGLRLYSC